MIAIQDKLISALVAAENVGANYGNRRKVVRCAIASANVELAALGYSARDAKIITNDARDMATLQINCDE